MLMAGGEVATIDASPDAAMCDFTQLVLQTLCKDEFAKKVTAVELALGEEQLVGASATLADSGVSLDAELLAALSTRTVHCTGKEASPEHLNRADRPAALQIPDGTTEIVHSVRGSLYPAWRFPI